ncbi:MAG: DNA primase [Anaerolineae bacterium]|nr:DNA primase [Anaerolineae bacterium]
MTVVDQVKERLDIVDVIKQYVHLQKAGRNLKGLCPFHTEKTPSLFVFPDSQHWHCFGCGRGGDVFNFVMEYESWDFRQALEELARRAGVELRPRTEEQIQAEEENERLRAALQATADYYHTLLKTAPQAEVARQYLTRRGFKDQTLKEFKLGYCLRSWDALRTHLLSKGFTVEELIKAGLLVEREQGGTYDRFRDRVMIPIYDRRGQIIGFGGRVLNDEDKPKYMNSPQTPLFDKSKILFGYDKAKRAIQEADAVIIVEGYMDVMIPYQEGYQNIVAPMGTALTEAHLKQLQRLTHNFILALDPDAAGVHATLRGLETARETLDRQWDVIFDPKGLVGYEGRLDADIRVLELPEGADPDELILQDPDHWQRLLDNAQPVIRFYFQQLLKQHNSNEPKGKARTIDAMLPLLQDIKNSVEREAYIQEIALQLGLNASALLDRLRTRERASAVRRQVAVHPVGRKVTDVDLEAYVLKILIYYPDLMELVNEQLMDLGLFPIEDDDFSASYRLIWAAWLDMLDDPEKDLEEVLLPDLQEQIRCWMEDPPPDASMEQWQRDLLRTILRLREKYLHQEYRQIHSLVIESQREGDLTGSQYATTIRELSAKLRIVQQALAQRG